jgi:hypothetical protein
MLHHGDIQISLHDQNSAKVPQLAQFGLILLTLSEGNFTKESTSSSDEST